MTDFTGQERDGRVSSLGTWISGLVASGLILIGAALILGLGSGHGVKNAQHITQLKPISARISSNTTRAIEDMRVGDRVLAGNPEGSIDEPEVDPTTWKRVDLLMRKEGIDIDIVLLRSQEWVDEMDAQVGGSVDLDLPEMDAVGAAHVRSVGPCPPIKPGHGRVVTGTFGHDDAAVLEVRLKGLNETIGVTAKHPIWSEDRKAFVPAGALKKNEHVNTLNGIVQVASEPSSQSRRFVYNLEVNIDHAYRVSSEGLLVHNGCAHPNNSAASMANNHVYEIINVTKGGTTYKYGISSGRIAANGNSYRATSQVNRLNALGGDRYASRIVMPPSPGRQAALDMEQKLVNAFAKLNNGTGPVGNILPTPFP